MKNIFTDSAYQYLIKELSGYNGTRDSFVVRDGKNENIIILDLQLSANNIYTCPPVVGQIIAMLGGKIDYQENWLVLN